MSPLAPVTCPQCFQVKGTLQEKVSNIAHVDVDYYRCDYCCHVWTMPKNGERRTLHDVATRRSEAES